MYSQIRHSFINFFKNRGHEALDSSSLIPKNDPSLLFTNSGMVQFKDIFTGFEKSNLQRAVTVQKCIRAGGKHNDLDNVGYTNRHHTFFEMLGNFSFGDYFKEEAITFAWDFLTKEIGLNKDKLYITVYHTDIESYNIWHKLTGWGDDKILKISTNDNFWMMGDTGPCGPCSEIFYDYGDGVSGGKPGTLEQDGPRFTEIWNLVFMQYEQLKDGSRRDLPKKSIDTGMGLERLISVLEGKIDNYETSLFQNIIRVSKDITKNAKSDGDIAYRILADHVRASIFLIADGVLPSNEGRGYILRRIIRRAIRHMYMVGCNKPTIHTIAEHTIGLMQNSYPEILRAKLTIIEQIKMEEERFLGVLPSGLALLEKEISKISASEKEQSGNILNGETAFTLYDTYGFPLDITKDICLQGGIAVDEIGFSKQMDEQKKRSKEHWKGSGDAKLGDIFIEKASKFGSTEFVGYAETLCKATVLDVFQNEAEIDGVWYCILDKTPFYPEGGGQVGDIGEISGLKIVNTFKVKDTIFNALSAKPIFRTGEVVECEIDIFRRKANQNAHSATHLLHHFLRQKFGNSIMQKGSHVENNRLRFDFSINKPLSSAEILEIEHSVNSYIQSNDFDITISQMNPESAFNSGAIGLFGEKYGDSVRVITIGDSKELCGGTHVRNIKDIGAFKIIFETSVASGIRRIEALTGIRALNYMLYGSSQLEEMRFLNKLPRVKSEVIELGVSSNPRDDIFDIFASKNAEIKSLKSDIAKLKIEISKAVPAVTYANVSLKILQDFTQNEIREAANFLKVDRIFTDKILVLCGVSADVASVCVFVSDGLRAKYNASDLIQNLAIKIGGKGGGGKMDFAMAGGISHDKIQDIIEYFKGL